MKLGVIADDFTGASDIALMLAEGGMRTTQFVGVPQADARGIDAGVVALKSRTIPAQEAIAQSLAACEWLLAQGAVQIVFKVCSTFDSTDQGNIGPVAAALAERLGETRVITCPAFPENGRSVYQGHLFVGDKLLNASGMQDHPLTPMRDADLRRVLARQTRWDVTHIDMNIIAQGPQVIEETLHDLPPSMVITDAITDADLHAIGTAAYRRKLLTGGSGIAMGLPSNFGFAPATPEWTAHPGPAVVLSGSCSTATQAQVRRFAATHPARGITAQEALGNPDLASELATWAQAQTTTPLIYSTADPAAVRSAQHEHGTARVAHAVEQVFASLATMMADAGTTRIIVAGGETSGAVVEATGAASLRIGPRLAAGVPALAVEGRGLSLALKSGNFGGPDFFSEAIEIMGHST